MAATGKALRAGPVAEGADENEVKLPLAEEDVVLDKISSRNTKTVGELWAVARSAVWSGAVKRLPFDPR